MALVPKNQYMQFRAQLERDGKPARHEEFEGLKKAVVTALESTGEVVVNKVRRTERPGMQFEATCLWTGVDPAVETIRDTVLAVWPGIDMPRNQESHTVEVEPDSVSIWFAAKADAGRFITGRVLVRI